MRIALVADTFPPLRTSGAVQLRDLSIEFVRQGHEITILLPTPHLDRAWKIENLHGVRVLRLRSPKTKDIGYARRTLGEIAMPFAMRRNFLASPLKSVHFDGIVWYAPSIFFGPIVSLLKKYSNCQGYLIIRDIFPEWAVDMGLMSRGFPYHFFSAVARYQYSVADIIGVQTPGNLKYFDDWAASPNRRLEVLQNWLADPVYGRCSIKIESTPLRGKRVFVYAGNMGVAQGMGILLELADRMSNRNDVGFVFVGRGSAATDLANECRKRNLSNVLFFDEIEPDEIPSLYSQCCAGLVALDPRHKTHNIPGKFLTYMQSGLPVLASVNPGNDLAGLIRRERVGRVCESNRVDDLVMQANELLDQISCDQQLPERCIKLFEREFSARSAVSQIVAAFARI